MTNRTEYKTYKNNKCVIETPRYVHDCEKCKFFGQFGKYDLWACIDERDYTEHNSKTIVHTVIARYGVDGEYTSGNSFICCNKELFECFHRVFQEYCGKIILEDEDYDGLLMIIDRLSLVYNKN